MIILKNVCKKFGGKVVLNNISWSFKERMIHGIIGRNGAGKSTFIKCLVGIEKYEGLISIPKNFDKRRIAYLPTEPFFFKRITGREYLKFISNSRKSIRQDFDEVNLFELPLDIYIDSYSTGMKKKLAFTSLLMDEFQIYFLDEPFNGVDMEGRLLIQEILKKLNELGKTVFISSHIVTYLSEVCQEIHYLNNGIFEETIHKENFKEFQENWNSQTINAQISKLNFGPFKEK
ncbi:ATP-binding cassette domain-containing protein [Belliella sp. DSM 107340]|uniref:ATP-binding cassette domain-containing protein n=1 Tax=Belliella calami TaxID=2923436 RepID=A0ABS9UK35_9BACT|nr:ATP-binding cassette domain-containing protein [Belliella calami]MCH7396981.1 ATP-binding cassette domain-containing protein [Belliella calami]